MRKSDLARVCGVSRSQIGDYLNIGNKQDMQILTFAWLCDRLGYAVKVVPNGLSSEHIYDRIYTVDGVRERRTKEELESIEVDISQGSGQKERTRLATAAAVAALPPEEELFRDKRDNQNKYIAETAASHRKKAAKAKIGLPGKKSAIPKPPEFQKPKKKRSGK